MLYGHILGQFAYPVLNTLGVVVAAIAGVLLVFLDWRRRRRTEGYEPLMPPDPKRKFNPLYYLTREMRGRYNPVTYAITCMAAYGVLQPGIRLMGMLLNVTVVLDKLRVFNSGIQFASGVLVAVPVFLLVAKFFPGNGKPTKQIELLFLLMPLTQTLNRLACFCSGCCHGIPSPFGVVYPDGAFASKIYGPGTRVFPNQLVESGIMFLCFLTILILRSRGKRTLPIFPLVFGAEGFLLGFLMCHKLEPLKPILGFTYPTPFTHLLVFFIGVFFLILVIREKKKARSGQGGSGEAEVEDEAEARKPLKAKAAKANRAE